jgi:succinate dehydrogenase/fumarate reductase flavoprotein subunit
MPNSDRGAFTENVEQGTLAAGPGVGLPEGVWLNTDDAAGTRNGSSTREVRLEVDVLVIGGGIAGCFAAIKAREQGAGVILVDKGFVGKSGQTPYARNFMAFNPDWGHELDVWMDYINKTSEYVNNRYWTEITIKESFARYQDLVSWGVQFEKGEDGQPIRYPAPPGVTDQLRFDAKNSGDYAQILRKQVVKSGGKILDRIMVAELLKQDGRIVGALGIPTDSDDLVIFIAKATILCVGGCGFKPAGYPPIVQLTGDGEAMAYRAGAEILGKEFVDTHSSRIDIPIGIPNMLGRKKNVPDDLKVLHGPSRGKPEVNAEGDEIPDRPAGASMYGYTYLEREFEVHAGRAPIHAPTPTGNRAVVGGACLGMSLRKADGLWPANTQCGSSLPGLYAAGDALGNMQNGAVYALTGSAIAGGAVTGTIAGVAAAKEALQMGTLVVNEKEITRAKQVVQAPTERQGGYSPRWVTQLLQNTMMPYFISYIKKADRLQATLTLVEFIQEHLVPRLFAGDPHELRLAHETKNMVLSAEMRLRSALFRTESRGNHYREDYPRRDDPDWLAWVKIKEEQGKIKLIKVPVPKEWWPDLSASYQQRYPFRFPGE